MCRVSMAFLVAVVAVALGLIAALLWWGDEDEESRYRALRRTVHNVTQALMSYMPQNNDLLPPTLDNVRGLDMERKLGYLKDIHYPYKPDASIQFLAPAKLEEAHMTITRKGHRYVAPEYIWFYAPIDDDTAWVCIDGWPWETTMLHEVLPSSNVGDLP